MLGEHPLDPAGIRALVPGRQRRRLRLPPGRHLARDREDGGGHDEQAVGHQGGTHRLRQLHVRAIQRQRGQRLRPRAKWSVAIILQVKYSYSFHL